MRETLDRLVPRPHRDMLLMLSRAEKPLADRERVDVAMCLAVVSFASGVCGRRCGCLAVRCCREDAAELGWRLSGEGRRLLVIL